MVCTLVYICVHVWADGELLIHLIQSKIRSLELTFSVCE